MIEATEVSNITVQISRYNRYDIVRYTRDVYDNKLDEYIDRETYDLLSSDEKNELLSVTKNIYIYVSNSDALEFKFNNVNKEKRILFELKQYIKTLSKHNKTFTKSNIENIIKQYDSKLECNILDMI